MKRTIIAKGNTYQIKEQLKTLGAKWNGSDWTLETMSAEEIEGVTFKIIFNPSSLTDITDISGISEAVEELRKIFLPKAIKRINELIELNENRKTFEEMKQDEYSGQHLFFKQYAAESFIVDRQDFENGRACREFRNEFKVELEKELDRVGTVKNFWK